MNAISQQQTELGKVVAMKLLKRYSGYASVFFRAAVRAPLRDPSVLTSTAIAYAHCAGFLAVELGIASDCEIELIRAQERKRKDGVVTGHDHREV